MAPSGFIDMDYLRTRVKVHDLRDAGFNTEEIGQKLEIGLRQAARYLRMKKPKLSDLGYNQVWREDAACKNHWDIFYPQVPGRRSQKIKAAAMAICATCPVIDRCRQAALANCETHGVWAGHDFSKVSYVFDETTGEIRVSGEPVQTIS